MGNLALKIKIWFKIGIFTLLAIYLLIFLLNNTGQPVTIWFWFGEHKWVTDVLPMIFLTIGVTVVFTLLSRMAFRTVRQVRELSDRNRKAKMEKDVADMQAKAGMLQTKDGEQKTT